MQALYYWPRVAALVVFWTAAAGSALGDDAADADADWPCVQRKVPEITAGVVWAGPDVDAAGRAWRRVDGLPDLVAAFAARRIPLEEAYVEIDKYAAAQADQDRKARLSALFVGLLQTINGERNKIISGIERFGRRQRSLAERIKTASKRTTELSDVDVAGQGAGDELARLEEQILWDTRLFDERNQLLSYVCESPVLLEQRLFALSRRIMSHLE